MLALCGRSDRREFAALASDVRELTGRLGVPVLDRRDFTADASFREVNFFLLLRSFPGEFNGAELAQFRRLSPLAPIVLIAGELCEGEDRTGDRFSGVRRFYADDWRERGLGELELFFDARGARGLFAASPLTTEREYLAERVESEWRRRDAIGERALILSDDASSIETLTRAFRASGAATAARSWEGFDFSESYVFPPSRVVVDANRFADATFWTKIRTLRDLFPKAFFDILTFSSSAFELERFENNQSAERIRFLTKPFSIATLLNCAAGSSLV